MAAPSPRSVGRLIPSSTALFVCDIQERFRSAISGCPAVISTANRLIRAANILDVPVLVTEQYPKALGNTVAELKSVLKPDTSIFPKFVFSMYVPEVQSWLKERPQVKQVILLGIEAHVCVLQTTLDLIENGYEVHLVVDGVSSTKPLDRAIALQRAAQAGALMTSSEMLMFQLAHSAKHPRFKEISAIVKEPRDESIPSVSAL